MTYAFTYKLVTVETFDKLGRSKDSVGILVLRVFSHKIYFSLCKMFPKTIHVHTYFFLRSLKAVLAKLERAVHIFLCS